LPSAWKEPPRTELRDERFATKAFVGVDGPDDRFRPGDRGHRTIATNGIHALGQPRAHDCIGDIAIASIGPDLVRRGLLVLVRCERAGRHRRGLRLGCARPGSGFLVLLIEPERAARLCSRVRATVGAVWETAASPLDEAPGQMAASAIGGPEAELGDEDSCSGIGEVRRPSRRVAPAAHER
jgi:hypothetical protein